MFGYIGLALLCHYASQMFYVILRSEATLESPGRESALYEVCNAFFHKVSVPGDCHATLAMTLSASHAVE